MGVAVAPFKFWVKHTRVTDNVVADGLSLISEGKSCEGPELTSAALLESLPLVCSSIEQYRADNPFCKDIKAKIAACQAAVEKFSVHKNLVCYFPKKAKRSM